MDDPNAWMADRINEAIPEAGRWTPSDIAEHLVAKLESEHPDEFAEWRRATAVDHIHQLINQRHRADRSRFASQSRARVFAQAAEDHQAGDDTAVDPYRIAYVVDEPSGIRMTLGEMTGSDCLTAAEPFHRRVNENAMTAAFLEAVAKKAQRRKVKNVLTREQLTSMMASIGMEVAA